MKTILSNFMLITYCLTLLTGCFGHCADWNCNNLNPRWLKKVDNCQSSNFETILQELGSKRGYKSIIQVQDSEIGQHAAYQCTYHDGRYDIRKDKQYSHWFTQKYSKNNR